MDTKKKVLICDDNRFMVEVLTLFIGDLDNVKVDVAVDGLEAIKKLTSDSYDLLMTDISMPFYTGNQIIDHLRNVLKSPIPIIVLSGYPDFVNQLQREKYKIDFVFSKPFDPDDLSNVVSKLLNQIHHEYAA